MREIRVSATLNLLRYVTDSTQRTNELAIQTALSVVLGIRSGGFLSMVDAPGTPQLPYHIYLPYILICMGPSVFEWLLVAEPDLV